MMTSRRFCGDPAVAAERRPDPRSSLYLRRHYEWLLEHTFDEIKTHLSDRAVPIRSETPVGVVPEIYGMILAHYVVGRVMQDAAIGSRRDPDRLSFTDSPRILQCRLPESPHHEIETWYHRLLREVRRQEVRPRWERLYPRVIKQKMSEWANKRPEQRRPRQPTKTSLEFIVILN
jgi:hypothetical protein